MKSSKEFQKFDNMMEALLKVPHSEIKAKLDAEKREKAAKKRKVKPSASRESGDREGT